LSNQNSKLDTLYKILSGVAIIIIGFVFQWGIATLQDLSVKMSVFESRSYPPKWAVDKLDQIYNEQRALRRQVDDIEKECDRIHKEPFSWEPEIEDEIDPAIYPLARGRLR